MLAICAACVACGDSDKKKADNAYEKATATLEAIYSHVVNEDYDAAMEALESMEQAYQNMSAEEKAKADAAGEDWRKANPSKAEEIMYFLL